MSQRAVLVPSQKADGRIEQQVAANGCETRFNFAMCVPFPLPPALSPPLLLSLQRHSRQMRRLPRHFLLVQHLFLRQSESSPGSCVGIPALGVASHRDLHIVPCCVFIPSFHDIGENVGKKRRLCIPSFLFCFFLVLFYYDLYVIDLIQCK